MISYHLLEELFLGKCEWSCQCTVLVMLWWDINLIEVSYNYFQFWKYENLEIWMVYITLNVFKKSFISGTKDILVLIWNCWLFQLFSWHIEPVMNILLYHCAKNCFSTFPSVPPDLINLTWFFFPCNILYFDLSAVRCIWCCLYSNNDISFPQEWKRLYHKLDSVKVVYNFYVTVGIPAT